MIPSALGRSADVRMESLRGRWIVRANFGAGSGWANGERSRRRLGKASRRQSGNAGADHARDLGGSDPRRTLHAGAWPRPAGRPLAPGDPAPDRPGAGPFSRRQARLRPEGGQSPGPMDVRHDLVGPPRLLGDRRRNAGQGRWRHGGSGDRQDAGPARAWASGRTTCS